MAIDRKIVKLLVVSFIFIFAFSLRLWDLNKMGRTWDESEYIEQGYKMVELLRKGDFDNSYFYTTYDHPPLVKYLYGITAHFDLERVLPSGDPIFKYDFTYSRLLSAVMFSLGVMIVVIMGWHFVSASVGVISGIILALLPFSLGLSQLVTAESAKIFIYPLAIYSYVRLLERYSVKKLIITAVITGIALQVKQSNILLFLLFACMTAVYCRESFRKDNVALVKKKFSSLVSIFIVSVVVFVLIWPQLLFHTEAINVINNKLWVPTFSTDIRLITFSTPEIFLGNLTLTPIYYYAVYFFITIPMLILGLFFIGLNVIRRTKNWMLISLFFWFFIPFIMSFYSWRQHGLRYIIEIYPAIAIISAIGFDALMIKFKIKEKLKLLYFFPIIIYLFILISSIKPYYLDYFNELVGGVNTVYKYKLFQIGWWGQGVREAAYYIVNNAKEGSTVGTALSPTTVMPKLENFDVSNYQEKREYDYVIVNYYNIIREGFDDSKIKSRYNVAYSVLADQAMLVTVYKHK